MAGRLAIQRALLQLNGCPRLPDITLNLIIRGPDLLELHAAHRRDRLEVRSSLFANRRAISQRVLLILALHGLCIRPS